jgi:hypothetical protein
MLRLVWTSIGFCLGAGGMWFYFLQQGVVPLPFQTMPVSTPDCRSSIRFAPHYYDRLTLFQQTARSYPVVMVGDSRIEYANWNELLEPTVVANRGIAGDTTAGVLSRLDPVLALSPERVFVQVGVNDLIKGCPPEDLVENYRQILLRFQSHNVELIVMSIILTSDIKLNEQIRKVNRELKALCAQFDVRWFDVNQVLGGGDCLAPEYTSDGVHLNGAGYSQLKKLLEQVESGRTK